MHIAFEQFFRCHPDPMFIYEIDPLRLLAANEAAARRLLAFARRQALEPQRVDLNRLVAGMDALLRRTLGEHIEIEIVRGGGLWPARVTPDSWKPHYSTCRSMLATQCPRVDCSP